MINSVVKDLIQMERKKARSEDDSFFDLIDEALLHNILRRLPAASFTFAACVSKLWNRTCNGILYSRPKLASAVSVSLSPLTALKEAVSSVLSEPIRPHFALAHVVGSKFDLERTLGFLAGKIGSKTPMIVTRSPGVMGRKASSSEHCVFNKEDLLYDDGTVESACVLLVIGFLPGLQVSVIPFQKLRKAVNGIRKFSRSASGSSSPSFIMMFGSEDAELKPIIDKLDEAMSNETIIAGNERCEFTFNIGGGAKIVAPEATGKIHAVTLVFANDMRKAAEIGEVGFHVGFSQGLFPVGPVFQALSCRHARQISTISGKREGMAQVLTGEEMASEIGIDVAYSKLFIAVSRKGRGDADSDLSSVVDFYGEIEGYDDHLHVQGCRVQTRDYFQFCLSPLGRCEAASREVSNSFKSLKEKWGMERVELIGGFIFACKFRRDIFFLGGNHNWSPFLDNFGSAPVMGLFCSGEIARGFSTKCFLNKVSSVYVGLSYSLQR